MTQLLKVAEVDMERARRKLKRKVAANIIAAMAETDADYEFIAKRMGSTAEEIEGWILGLITGRTKCMDEASDLLLAMGCEFEFSIQPYREPRRPQENH